MTPLRVEQTRLRNDAGFLSWRGLSEFSAVHLCRTGQEAELVRRLDRAQAAGRNGIRVLMMASNLFDLRPSYPGYWAAADRVVTLAAERGLYVEACLFADAQIILPDVNQRRAVVFGFADWCRLRATVLPSLANEAFKNGWTGATDPALLALADTFATNYGRLFSISDPQDVVTDPATGQPLRGDLVTLAARSVVLVLHGERKPQDTRWAGWVDHLKGFDEVFTCPTGCYRIHDEPMGAAAVYQDGRRDNRPLAHLAASLVCAVMGIGFTYHYISEQDDATPGLDLCAAAALVPQTPDYTFRNAGTFGAAVLRFEGYDKIRTCDNGVDAWAVGYGHRAGTVEWQPGWTPRTVEDWRQTVDGQDGCVTLWRATR